MKLRLLGLFVAFFSPFLTLALGYNLYDYDPDYRPYNLEQALDFNECSNSIEEFDQIYSQLTDEYVYQQANPEGKSTGALADTLSDILNTLESNKFNYQIEFGDCIKEGTTNAEKEAAEKAEKERRERAAAELQSAIDNCDFDYFENEMTQTQRMETFEERKACEEKLKESEQTPEVQISTPVSIPVQTTYTPPTQTTTYTPPLQTSVVRTADTNVTEEETDDVSTSTEATSTPKEMTVTEEELDRIVQEKLDAALANQEVESEPEPEKPSIFKRVFSFLFGWL